MTRQYFDSTNTVVPSDKRQSEGYRLDYNNIPRKIERTDAEVNQASRSEAIADINSIKKLQHFFDSRKVTASASMLGLTIK